RARGRSLHPFCGPERHGHRPDKSRAGPYRAAHVLEDLRHGRHPVRRSHRATRLLEKLIPQGGGSAMPITALVAASASLKHEHLVPERKLINTTIREKTFDWLRSQGYSFTPSQANFFMLDAKRPAKQVIDALAAQKVFIGRIWPAWPTHLRISVGTQAEMDTFQTSFAAVMKNSASVSYALPSRSENSPHRDGFLADGIMFPRA